MAKDYYAILGVQKNASREEILRAYKKLAKQFHPDINNEKGAEEKFKEVQHAYSVLGDEQKRRNYDQFGSEAEKFSGFSGFDTGGFRQSDFNFEDIFESSFFGSGFSDIFGQAFGQNSRGGPRRGEDIAMRMNLSFEEAVFGAKKQVEIERVEECGNCSGSGARPGTKKTECGQCHGSGIERHSRKTFLGTISTQNTCAKCQGAGEIAEDPCPVGGGGGLERKRKKISVNIPAGINTGNNLRLHNQGNAGEKDAGHGDLVLIIYVEPHEVFKRDGFDIFMEVPLSFSEAALGSEVEIPTLKGKANLKVPAGTQGGTIFKMRGRGIKKLSRGEHGDQHVKVVLRTPEKLSKKEKELFEKLSKEEEVRAKRKSFFDGFKGIFE